MKNKKIKIILQIKKFIKNWTFLRSQLSDIGFRRSYSDKVFKSKIRVVVLGLNIPPVIPHPDNNIIIKYYLPQKSTILVEALLISNCYDFIIN